MGKAPAPRRRPCAACALGTATRESVRKEECKMINAGISNAVRKRVYRRDGWRCALCDSTDGIQIHHVEWRGRGGSSEVWNLITLCWRCHAEAHGTRVYEGQMDEQEMEYACIEYLADYYGGNMRG